MLIASVRRGFHWALNFQRLGDHRRTLSSPWLTLQAALQISRKVQKESTMVDDIDPPIDEGDENGNVFDPRKLRISQRFGQGQDVRRILVSVPVRKPHRQEFFRTHPDPEMSIAVALLELREDRQTYLVSPELAPYLPGEAVIKLLVTTISSHGALFLWPIKLPDERGRLDEWNAVALEAAERAKSTYIRLIPNMKAGTYDVVEAANVFPDPIWPEATLEKLLEMGFKDRFIDSMDHPVLRRLRGEF
jgi:hypothetical protein